eukprot:4127490-Pyramimonas_sp.AAC.2
MHSLKESILSGRDSSGTQRCQGAARRGPSSSGLEVIREGGGLPKGRARLAGGQHPESGPIRVVGSAQAELQ